MLILAICTLERIHIKIPAGTATDKALPKTNKVLSKENVQVFYQSEAFYKVEVQAKYNQ